MSIQLPQRARQLALLGWRLGFDSRSVALDIKGAVTETKQYPVEQIEAEVLRIWKENEKKVVR